MTTRRPRNQARGQRAACVLTLWALPSKLFSVIRKVAKKLLAWNGPFALRPQTRAFSPVLGCDKYFVTFREAVVSRRATELPEGWRLRERQRPSLLESSDARADSNRPSGRFRSAAGFRVPREAPVRLHEHKTFSCGIKRCCDAASETSRGLSPTTIRTSRTDYRPAGQARRKP